jgi:hypothetical protein
MLELLFNLIMAYLSEVESVGLQLPQSSVFGQSVFLALQSASSVLFIIAEIELYSIVHHCIHFISISGTVTEVFRKCYGERTRLVGEAAIASGSGLSREKLKVAV